MTHSMNHTLKKVLYNHDFTLKNIKGTIIQMIAIMTLKTTNRFEEYDLDIAYDLE